MTEQGGEVRFFVFDVEAVADGDLVSRIRYPDEDLTPQQAIRKYRDELLEERGRDMLPYTFMLPISVAVGKVDAAFRLIDIAVLDAPEFRPAVITRHFWAGYRHYGRPTLVTFNGRGYDLPLLELAAFRYGLSLPEWFNVNKRSFEQSRNRYNVQSHLDLLDLISNFGAARVNGGLNLVANLIGKPGKTDVDGSQVQDLYDEGQVQKINDYCRCDVLDTYFVFLRSMVLTGRLRLEREQQIVSDTKTWLQQHAEKCPAYTHYLQHWGDWQPPNTGDSP